MRSMLTATPRRSEQREGAARVAVLGLADRAAVDEQHSAVFVHPRFVRVAEYEHRVALGRREAFVEAGRLVLEQVLVDFPW